MGGVKYSRSQLFCGVMRRIALVAMALVVFHVPVWALSTIWVASTLLVGGGPHSYSSTTGKVYVQAYNTGTSKYAIYETDLSGAGPTNLTSGVYAMDDDYGIPQVSPDGAWILALRHDTTLTGTDCDTASEWQPGQGVCNDLVIIKVSDGTLTVLVEGTNIPGTAEKFTFPHWCADQTKIVYVQYNTTAATIRVADISLGATPALSNIKTSAPADADGFYEAWGFLDSACQEVLFACLCEVGDVANDIDLAKVSFASGTYTKLTDTDERLEEHAAVDKFGRDLILYSDNADSSNFFDWDFYTMRKDGSGKQRVTYFNDANDRQFFPTQPNGYFTVANPEWVSQTQFLMHGTTDWTYPSTGNLVLMGYGQQYASRMSNILRVRVNGR